MCYYKQARGRICTQHCFKSAALPPFQELARVPEKGARGDAEHASPRPARESTEMVETLE